MRADVVVIGAGALGLSTALHCALSGRSVAVIDRHRAGSQASGRAAGLFKSVQADELRTTLARRSIARAISFADWAGVPLPVARSGSFLIARTERHKAVIEAEAACSRGWGANVRAATPAELAGQVSYYRGSGHELAIWCPEDIYIEEPISLVQAYLAACRRHGVDVLESEPVTGVLVSGGRVNGVETAARQIAAADVVDAAGAWARQVAELAGGSLAVAPVRHQRTGRRPGTGRPGRQAAAAAESEASMSLKKRRCTRSFSWPAGITYHRPVAGPSLVDRGSSMTTPRAFFMLLLPASRTRMRCWVTTKIRYRLKPRKTKTPVSAASHWLAVCAPKTACTVSPGCRYGVAESRIASRNATDPPGVGPKNEGR